MQREITEKINLLDKNGEIISPGWARNLLWKYNRENIKAPKFKIKEWDYYCILSRKHGIALTLSDMGYLGFIGITLFNFEKPEEISRSLIVPFPMGSFKMPRNSETGISEFKNKTVKIIFNVFKNKRVLTFSWKKFLKGDDLSGTIDLTRDKDQESIVVATPFITKKHTFYYNQKINCLSADGEIFLGKKKTTFKPEDSFGVLDWGRGVWTYSNTWYWASASGTVDNAPFGFNLGCGFGNLSTHSENALFFNGKLHKLDRIRFEIPEEDYLSPWSFDDNEGRFNMHFMPIIDRSSYTNLLLIKSDQHQVFGRFSGKAVLDDGTALEIKNLTGFAEKVFNLW